jgi:hypothetical protein
MQAIRRIAKPVSYVVTAGMLALSLHIPLTQAALVTTETLAAAAQAEHNRDRINTLLTREEVHQALSARGVDPAEIQSRIGALTDQELQQLATKLDELPAGGSSVLGFAALVFIVLVILDAACVTDLFAFIKKDHCKKK